jgi:hypothetical protein
MPPDTRVGVLSSIAAEEEHRAVIAEEESVTIALAVAGLRRAMPGSLADWSPRRQHWTELLSSPRSPRRERGVRDQRAHFDRGHSTWMAMRGAALESDHRREALLATEAARRRLMLLAEQAARESMRSAWRVRVFSHVHPSPAPQCRARPLATPETAFGGWVAASYYAPGSTAPGATPDRRRPLQSGCSMLPAAPPGSRTPLQAQTARRGKQHLFGMLAPMQY